MTEDVSKGDTVRFRHRGVRTGEVVSVYERDFGPYAMVKYRSGETSSSTTIEEKDIVGVVE